MGRRDDKRSKRAESPFEVLYHEAQQLFEAVDGGPLILDPVWVDPVIAESPKKGLESTTGDHEA